LNRRPFEATVSRRKPTFTKSYTHPIMIAVEISHSSNI
jgi:hypothetical protein